MYPQRWPTSHWWFGASFAYAIAVVVPVLKVQPKSTTPAEAPTYEQ